MKKGGNDVKEAITSMVGSCSCSADAIGEAYIKKWGVDFLMFTRNKEYYYYPARRYVGDGIALKEFLEFRPIIEELHNGRKTRLVRVDHNYVDSVKRIVYTLEEINRKDIK